MKRWPGGLTEYYGMTEGGATFSLYAHLHPTKLHTVGQLAPEHQVKLLDEQGNEVRRSQIGEVVGRSPAAMMTGYYGKCRAHPPVTNERLGKTQRLTALEIVSSLPRSPIGKVLKRELRDLHRNPCPTCAVLPRVRPASIIVP